MSVKEGNLNVSTLNQ